MVPPNTGQLWDQTFCSLFAGVCKWGGEAFYGKKKKLFAYLFDI